MSYTWHRYVVCPNCRLELRHRLLMGALTHIDGLLLENIVKNKRVLHFAPEGKIKNKLQDYAAKYQTADLLRRDNELMLNISNMKAVEDQQYDLVIACDVLEHVPNDIKAMQEIYRVLTPGGFAILTVPQKDNLEKTLEDPKAVTPEDRENLFGAPEHLRVYGNNFPELLQSVGFRVSMVNEGNFPKDMVKKHVLFPPILSPRPLATNYRKVFFAQKAE